MSIRILPKDSASPTILIQGTMQGYKVTLKVWLTGVNRDDFKALDYEKEIYSKVVANINEPNIPILKSLAHAKDNRTILDLYKGFKLVNKEDKVYLLYALYLYSKNPVIKIPYVNDKKKLIQYVKNSLQLKNDEILNFIRLQTFNIIVLPTIDMVTLSTILKTPNININQLIDIIKQLVYGIHLLYNNGIIHNDLHSKNIMIDTKTLKSYIYDFDRSYVPRLGPNPSLSKDRCNGGYCSSSQCNIYNGDGYAIDLYKILFYIFRSQSMKINMIIAKSIFPGHNTSFYSKLIKITTRNAFFYKYEGYSKCTFLQFPDEDMKYLHRRLGGINTIRKNLEIQDEEGDVHMGFKKNEVNYNKKIKSKNNKELKDITYKIEELAKKDKFSAEDKKKWKKLNRLKSEILYGKGYKTATSFNFERANKSVDIRSIPSVDIGDIMIDKDIIKHNKWS